MIQQLRSPAEVEDVIRTSRDKRLFILKHSPRCSLCHQVLETFQTFAEAHPDVGYAYVDVVAHREVSNFLSNEAQITHQSPQVILFVQGRPAWHESHSTITSAALEAQLS